MGLISWAQVFCPPLSRKEGWECSVWYFLGLVVEAGSVPHHGLLYQQFFKYEEEVLMPGKGGKIYTSHVFYVCIPVIVKSVK